MTTAADRRVAKLETALTPTEAVLAWLVEAQQFPTIEDQARAIAQLPIEAAPLSVIAQRVETAVRSSMKGRPNEDVREAVRRNLGDAAFLLSLVMEVNGQTVEMARVEGLRAAAVFFWMGTLLGGPRASDLPAAEKAVYVQELADAWASWRSVLGRLRLDVKVENDARTRLEKRYFAGRDVLFADSAQIWTEHVDLVERLAGLANVLAPATKPTGHRQVAINPESAVAIGERVARRVARLADDARVRAFEIIGERERALAIMERRLLAD